jgi:hypothetical protein
MRKEGESTMTTMPIPNAVDRIVVVAPNDKSFDVQGFYIQAKEIYADAKASSMWIAYAQVFDQGRMIYESETGKAPSGIEAWKIAVKLRDEVIAHVRAGDYPFCAAGFVETPPGSGNWRAPKGWVPS